jgi:hypothetical protein
MSPKVPFSRLALGAKLRLLLHPSFFMSSDPVFRSSDQSPPAPIRFGVFEADLRAGELRRNGIKVRLQDLPFRVLTLLLARPGVVIMRVEFRQALWPPDVFVDFEQGISSAVMRLRDALRDSADNPIFIETVERLPLDRPHPSARTGRAKLARSRFLRSRLAPPKLPATTPAFPGSIPGAEFDRLAETDLRPSVAGVVFRGVDVPPGLSERPSRS